MIRARMRLHRLLFALVLLAPPVALAEQKAGPNEITACAARNLAEPQNVRALRITRRDAKGNETTHRLRLFGRRTPDGLRQLVVRVEDPPDVRGAAFLMLERTDGNDVYLWSPDLPKVKHVSSSGRKALLFGTDLTFEDFEFVHGISRLGGSKRLPDEKLQERPVYVIETLPASPEDSSYARIVSYVDQATCVALRIDFFEADGKLRRDLVVNPDWLSRRGDLWIAQMATMRDLRDFSTMQVLVDSTEQNVSLKDEMFTVEGFPQAKP
jgi:hypothetical protein